VAELAERYPQLSLRLDLYDRVIDLVAEGVDLEILVGDDIPEQHIGKKLAQHQRILCASPAYLQAHGVPESLEDLTEHQCLVLKERDNPFGIWSVTAEGEEQRIRVKGALSSNSGEVVLQWALKHHGIILRSQWDVQPYLDSGELVQVLPAYSQPASVWAVYPTRLADSAKLRVCVEFFQQRFSLLFG
jgi:LysR family transcriptional activator of dmlA